MLQLFRLHSKTIYAGLQGLAALGALCCLQGPALAELGPVRVRLKSEATCHGTMVLLKDIAEISQVSMRQREQLESLDIAELPRNQDVLAINASLVQLRLELAAAPDSSCQVIGAAQCMVRRPPPVSYDEQVKLLVQEALAESWGVDPSHVRVKLLQPLDGSLLTGLHDRTDLDVALLPNPRPGNNRVRLLVHKDGRLVNADEVLVNSQLFAETAIAVHDLDRGVTLEPHMLTSHWEAVSSPDRLANPADLIGKQLNVSVRRGQSVQARHVKAVQPRGAEPVVKPRDRVRVIVRKGNLAVTLADAEVLQAGSVGDDVRVRNPQTNKVITARVSSADECTIRL